LVLFSSFLFISLIFIFTFFIFPFFNNILLSISLFHAVQISVCLALSCPFIFSYTIFFLFFYSLFPSCPFLVLLPFLSPHCSYLIHTHQWLNSVLYQLYTLLPSFLSPSNP
jgi:hypothetical protein